jgi:DNA-binding GntR family transcriptional regulator
MPKDEVYEAIKHKILLGYYKPSDPLNERELMEEYKIGKTPLREVFFRLQHDGLIRRFPRLGTVVSPLDTKKLYNVAEIRHHLEGIVAKLAVERISDATLEEIRVGIEVMKKAIEEEDRSLFASEEAHLHSLLYAATGNLALKEFIEAQYSLFTRAWFMVERTPVDLTEQLNDWKNIYQGLREKDVEKTAESNMKHFERYFVLLRSL